MPLKTRKPPYPPFGWKYTEGATGWEAPFPLSDTFEKTVARIIEHRNGNPRFNLPTDFNTVADQLDLYTCVRLRNDPHYCDGPEADKKKDQAPAARQRPSNKPSHRPPVSQRIAQAVQGLKRSAVGSRILTDWLGSGGQPVPIEQANNRANTCVICPLNNMENDWFFGIPKAVAMAIHEQRKVKLQMDMKVDAEDKIGACDACGCYLPIKVWTPLKHILAHTPKDEFEKLDRNCWVRKEQ